MTAVYHAVQVFGSLRQSEGYYPIGIFQVSNHGVGTGFIEKGENEVVDVVAHFITHTTDEFNCNRIKTGRS